MAIPNISKLTDAELDALSQRIEERRATLREERVTQARNKMEALLQKEGLSWSEIAPRRSAKKKSKLPPKFRNPRNPEQTWGGRGKRPDWLRAAIKRGAKPEQFLIRR